MIQADKKAFEADLYHSSLGIKEREMTNLIGYLTNLGTQAALVAGFGIEFFSENPAGTSQSLSLLFYMLVAICIGSQLYVVCNSTLCTVLGPTMGLVGPRGSMHVSVTGLYAERQLTWGMFAAGLFTFNAAFISRIWILIPDKIIAWCCTILMIAICGITVMSSKRILDTFEFKNETEHLSGVEYMKQKVIEDKEQAQNGHLVVSNANTTVL